MNTTEPLLIHLTRIVGGHYIARAGVRVTHSTTSGLDAAKACAAAALGCPAERVELAKHAPGVLRATVRQES